MPFKLEIARAARAMPIRLTAPMKRRLTRRVHGMIERSLQLFPELSGALISIGYTRKHLGSATIEYRKGTITRMTIRLRARKVTYQTIGHELTHLVQGLARGGRVRASAVDPTRIPAGEQQCDIWTLARDPLFCDDPPTYIRMPRALRERWADYAEPVRELCIAAIAKRHRHRQYIRWLEAELGLLAKRSPRPGATEQLSLPFGD